MKQFCERLSVANDFTFVVLQRASRQRLCAGKDATYPLALMVSELNRIVGVAALEHARADEIRNRGASPWISVGDHHAVRVMVSNRTRSLFGYTGIVLRVALESLRVEKLRRFGGTATLEFCQFRRIGQNDGLVDQIEAESLTGNALVTIGEEGPLMHEGVERVRIGEYVSLFLRDRNARQLFVHGVENAYAGRTVKTHVHMNPVFFPQPDGSVDRFDLLLVDGEEIGSGPEAVIHGQAHPVEAPVANPAEVVLEEHPIVLVREILHPIGIGGEIFEQIKAVKDRVLLGRS